MTNSIEDIISELEFEFSDKPSIKNSIQCMGGETMRIDKNLWDASPVLRAHYRGSSSFLKICAPKSTVEDLFKAQRNGDFPQGFSKLLNLLAVCGQLELKGLTSACFKRLINLDGFIERDFPSECSSEAVMEFLKILLRSPLRTADIYKRQLARIAKLCDNNQEVMTNAVNLMKEKLEKIAGLKLHALPVDFNRRTVPVLIYESLGESHTGVLDGNQLKPLDVFEGRFEHSRLTIEDSFFLKHGSQVIFKSGSRVYVKDLRDNTDPAVLTSCTLLLTRAEFVFAVKDDGERSSVMLFMDDFGFVKIIGTNDKIKAMDFEIDEDILALKLLTGPILIFSRMEDNSFILSHKKDIRNVKDLMLVGKQMFILTENPRFLSRLLRSRLDRYQILPPTDSLTPDATVVLGRGEVAIKKSGNTFFLIDSGGLHIIQDFPSFDELKTLPSVEKLFAISELWLSC